MVSAKPFLCFLPAFAFIAMTLAVASYRGQALTARQWLLIRGVLASGVTLVFVQVCIADRGIMGIRARWVRVMLRGLWLLSVAVSIVPSFIALDYAAHMLHLGAAATNACAVVLVAVYLYIMSGVIFGV